MAKIFLIGVSCVGVTSIGRDLSLRIGHRFHDLGPLIEEELGMTMPVLNRHCFTMTERRKKCRPVLEGFIERNKDEDYVMALTPGSLMDHKWRAVKKEEDRVVVVIKDRPLNIMRRAVFYDDEQNVIKKRLNDRQKLMLLESIKEDISYFRRTHARGDIHVDIDGGSIAEASDMIIGRLREKGIITHVEEDIARCENLHRLIF